MAELSLTEFLLARIAEDEDGAGQVEWDGGMCQTNTGVHIDTTRWLAECEAKRRIWHEVEVADGVAALHLLRLLALPYADHPDYQQEWRP